MASQTQSLLAVGDIILGAEGESYFTSAKPILQAAAVVLGQLEVPHTTRDRHAVALHRTPDNLAPLVSAGFDAVTLASNHIADAGEEGIEDTLAWLRAHHIAYTGGGMDSAEARRPLNVERDGTRFGCLNYNCVGPKETWATSEKPGCAYVHVLTHYELDHATPGGPPNIYTWAETKSLRAMTTDIRQLREQCEVLVVSFHKGIAHTPVKLAEYEQQVSYAAIEAGADLVIAHHAHILKGIEVYKGKAIFHGLGNFAVWLPLLAPQSNQDPLSWAKRRRELFGFEPDPAYPTYPFHPEAKYTLIARCVAANKQVGRVSYVPCIVNQQGHPEVVRRGERGQEVFDYVEKISRAAGFDTRFAWLGDEVEVKLN
jgi:poly-gamma-glutamate synthesis protein (capsule biosynthesis protein)